MSNAILRHENSLLLKRTDGKSRDNDKSSTDDKRSSVTSQEEGKCSCFGRKLKKETLLVILTIIGVLLGILIGCLVRIAEPSPDTITLVMFPGEMLMRMLKMLIIPIIITSVITGLASLDMNKSGRMGLHAAAYYISTTTIAVILGMLLVCAIQPGNPSQRNDEQGFKQRPVSTVDTFLDLIRNLFPDNIIAACFQVAQTQLTEIPADHNAISLLSNVTTQSYESTNQTLLPLIYEKSVERVDNTNVLGIIVFSVFFGIMLSSLGQEGKPVVDFFAISNKIFMKMIIVIIWYSPIGICSLIAGNLLKIGNFATLVETLGMYMLTVIVGLVIHGTIILPLIFYVMTRNNPYRYYAGVFQAWLTALGTASSAGTLPVTMQCLEKNLGIDRRVTQFVLPLGATMNMDGTALLEGVAAITIAQMYQYNLSFGQLVTISVTATFASIGAAAIPSAGLITLLLVLSAIGLPTEAVGVLWSIDWFLDRLRTSVNVLGDCIGAGIVQHLNQQRLNEDDPSRISESEKSSRLLTVANDEQLCDSGLSMMEERRDQVV